jgi:hypothetical protein
MNERNERVTRRGVVTWVTAVTHAMLLAAALADTRSDLPGELQSELES